MIIHILVNGSGSTDENFSGFFFNILFLSDWSRVE